MVIRPSFPARIMSLALRWMSELTPWQKVQVARHRERPYTLDYLQWAFSDFFELHGDRR